MSWIWNSARRKTVQPRWDEKVAAPSRSGVLDYLYLWERGCRGYDLFSGHVAVEPLYVPFGEDAELSPLQLAGALPEPAEQLNFIPLTLPESQRVPVATTAGWLQSLPLHRAASFEIVGSSEQIAFQIACRVSDSTEMAAVLPMYFPTSVGLQADPDGDVLFRALNDFRGRPVGYSVVDFGLLNFAYRPIRRFSSFEPDPLGPIVAALSALREGEAGGMQLLFTKARRPWGNSLESLVGLFGVESGPAIGDPTSSGRNEEQRYLREKLASPLYAAILRVFAVSEEGDDSAFALCRRIGGALAAFTEPGSNALLALSNEGADHNTPEDRGYEYGAQTIDYPDEAHFRDLLTRRSRRSGFLISADELVGLMHPPSENLVHPKLARPGSSEERVLPQHLLDAAGSLLGGYSVKNGLQPVVWPDEYRNRHGYLLGATRMGKSTLLLNLIAQDLEEGKGLCLIDPHGDLAQDVLSLVPAERMDDVLYLDFGDREHPAAIGLLEAADEWEQRLVVSDLLSILHRLFAASWGDRLEHILRHVLLTLLCEPGHTLRDVRPLLSDKEYRDQVLRSVHDPELRNFWKSEFHGYSASTFSPIYNKLGLLLSSPVVRNIVAQKESRLPLSSVMRDKRVLIVNLNSAQVGQDNAHFLGAMLVSKIQIAAMQSLRRGRAERVPFTLYVDEFQNFVVSSFENILSEAGKAGLSLVMANQFLEQLNGSLQSAILGNVGTLVSFRVSADSGRLLEKELAGRFRQEEIISLQRGEAIVRLGQAMDSVKIATLPPPQPSVGTGVSEFITDSVLAQTWAVCCRPRAEVEAEIAGSGTGPVAAVKAQTNVPTADVLIDETVDVPEPKKAAEKPEQKGLPDTPKANDSVTKPAKAAQPKRKPKAIAAAATAGEFTTTGPEAKPESVAQIPDVIAENPPMKTGELTSSEPLMFGLPDDAEPVTEEPSQVTAIYTPSPAQKKKKV